MECTLFISDGVSKAQRSICRIDSPETISSTYTNSIFFSHHFARTRYFLQAKINVQLLRLSILQASPKVESRARTLTARLEHRSVSEHECQIKYRLTRLGILRTPGGLINVHHRVSGYWKQRRDYGMNEPLGYKQRVAD